MKMKLILLYVLVWQCYMESLVGGAEQQRILGNFKNSAAVKEVLSGDRTVANASWWGFDENDSTDAIQGAINSGASKVIIPFVGKDWIVQPIKLANNQEVVFESGVVVSAKKGMFKGKGDSLFSALSKNNITLRGYGATLRMQKKDYMGSDYVKAEWRHVICLRSCRGITVSGLTLRDSGGDGIYLGLRRDSRGNVLPNRDIMVRDCIFDNNYRQGIMVISVENVRIKNCVFRNTRGTPPSAGIGIEPYSARSRMVNVVISECVSENNAGPGFMVSLRNLSSESEVVSILFVDCYVKSGKKSGIQVGAILDKGPKGLIEFKNCTVQNTSTTGLYIANKSTDSALLRFNNCTWQNVATRGTYPKASTGVPIYLVLRSENFPAIFGGIEFINCYVYDSKDRPFLAFVDKGKGSLIRDVRGEIQVDNPYGARMNWGKRKQPAGLKVNTLLTSK